MDLKMIKRTQSDSLSKDEDVTFLARYHLVSRETRLVSRGTRLVSRETRLVFRETRLVSRQTRHVSREARLVQSRESHQKSLNFTGLRFLQLEINERLLRYREIFENNLKVKMDLFFLPKRGQSEGGPKGILHGWWGHYI